MPLSRSTNPLYCCEVCSTCFTTHLDIALHSNMHYPRYHCHLCNFESALNVKVIAHMVKHSKNPKLRCNYCTKLMKNEKELKQHKLEQHMEGKKFECYICRQNFPLSWWLTLHQRNVHQVEIDKTKYYKCHICKKVFGTVVDRLRHIQGRYYKMKRTPDTLCEICGLTIANFKTHMRTHTGEKPYECLTCGKKFTKASLLVEHERIHTGVKPYKCTICNKGFTQRTSMKIHERTHTGERPYGCVVCNKGFICAALLNAHKKNCQGPICYN